MTERRRVATGPRVEQEDWAGGVPVAELDGALVSEGLAVALELGLAFFSY